MNLIFSRKLFFHLKEVLHMNRQENKSYFYLQNIKQKETNVHNITKRKVESLSEFLKKFGKTEDMLQTEIDQCVLLPWYISLSSLRVNTKSPAPNWSQMGNLSHTGVSLFTTGRKKSVSLQCWCALFYDRHLYIEPVWIRPLQNNSHQTKKSLQYCKVNIDPLMNGTFYCNRLFDSLLPWE